MAKELDIIDVEEQRDIAILEQNLQAIAPRQTITLSPEQTEFVEAGQKGYREILFSGGRGAGKSLALICKLLEYVAYPNTTVALIRQNCSDLKKTTVRLMLYGETQKDGTYRPPLLPPQAVKSYNRIDGIIELWNGSVILLLGCIDPEKLKSLQCSACFVEEVSQIARQSFIDITLLPRQYHPLGNKIYAATNPLGKKHYLYRYFVTDRVATRKIIFVDSRSNAQLDPAYIAALNSLPPEQRKRQLEGQWTEETDGVFDCFDRTVNVQSCKYMMTPEKCSELICSQDIGGGSKWSAFHVLGKGFDGKIYVFEEHTQKQADIASVLRWFDGYRALSGGCCVYDKNNSAFIPNEMASRGWKMIASHNDLQSSEQLLNALFSEGTLVIDPSCEVLIQELEIQERDPDTGKWRKMPQNKTDALDSARYGIWHLADMSKEHKQKKDFWWIG